MGKPEYTTVCTSIDGTFVALYGEPVSWITLWAEPSVSRMDLASNVNPEELLRCLREAVKCLEAGVAGREVLSVTTKPRGHA